MDKKEKLKEIQNKVKDLLEIKQKLSEIPDNVKKQIEFQEKQNLLERKLTQLELLKDVVEKNVLSIEEEKDLIKQHNSSFHVSKQLIEDFIDVINLNSEHRQNKTVHFDSLSQKESLLSALQNLNSIQTIGIGGGAGKNLDYHIDDNTIHFAEAAIDHSSITNLSWSTAGHTIDEDIIPETNNTFALGSTTNRFATLNTGAVNSTGSILTSQGDVTAFGNVTANGSVIASNGYVQGQHRSSNGIVGVTSYIDLGTGYELIVDDGIVTGTIASYVP